MLGGTGLHGPGRGIHDPDGHFCSRKGSSGDSLALVEGVNRAKRSRKGTSDPGSERRAAAPMETRVELFSDLFSVSLPVPGFSVHENLPVFFCFVSISQEDVDAFMAQPGNESADAALKKLDERYQKYKFMELSLAQRKRRLKAQIPEIKQTLEILKYMQRKKASPRPMETRFLLADNLYCKAAVPPTDRVCLWLGANVMLEYDVDEARALLERNLAAAARNLEALEDDLDFLRDQFTTTEVNMARVYNWDVKRRSRDDAAKGKA